MWISFQEQGAGLRNSALLELKATMYWNIESM